MSQKRPINVTEVCRECGFSRKAVWKISSRTPDHFENNRHAVDFLCAECDWKTVLPIIKEVPKLRPVAVLIKNKVCFIRGGARSRGIVYNLTIADILKKFIEQDGYCAVSGEELCDETGRRNLSVDRIDNDLGYCPQNIALVCSAVNIMRGQLTMEEFIFWSSKVADNFGVHGV